MKKSWIATMMLPVVFLAACSSGSESSESTPNEGASELIIGFAAALSGDGAAGDVPALEGLQYAVDQYNANGGIDGHPVKLISKDMKSDSALGGTVAQELIDQGAQILVGPAFPGMAAGVIQAGAKAGVAVISAVATQPEYILVGGESPVFLAAFGDNVQASAAAEYALKQGAKTAFTISSPDISYTENLPKFFTDAFEKGGGSTLGDVTYNLGQTDFSVQVTQIANLPIQPDILYAAMFPPDTSNFVRALRSAGVTARIFGPDGFDMAALLDAGTEALEGTWFTTHGWNTPGTQFAEFVDGMTTANGNAPEAPALAALGDTTAKLIAAAVEQAGSLDPAAIATSMANLVDVATPTGTISYLGTNGIPSKTVTIGAVEGGKFVFKEDIVPVYIAQP